MAPGLAKANPRQVLPGPGVMEDKMSAQTKTSTVDYLAEAVKRALDDAKGDVREATRMLEEAVRQSRRLRDLLLEPLISNACYDAIRAQVRVDRRDVWKAPVVKLVPSNSGVTGSFRVAQLSAGTLLMFPLPGGLRLGEATRSEVVEAAGFYASQASDMAHKSRWLMLVAQCVPEDKTVGDVLTDKRLRDLQEATCEKVH